MYTAGSILPGGRRDGAGDLMALLVTRRRLCVGTAKKKR